MRSIFFYKVVKMQKTLSLLIVASLVLAMSILCGCPAGDAGNAETTTATIMEVKGKIFKFESAEATFTQAVKDKITAGTLSEDEKKDIASMLNLKAWDDSITADNIDSKAAEALRALFVNELIDFNENGVVHFTDDFYYAQEGEVVSLHGGDPSTPFFTFIVDGNKIILDNQNNLDGDAPSKVIFVKKS